MLSVGVLDITRTKEDSRGSMLMVDVEREADGNAVFAQEAEGLDASGAISASNAV